MDRVRVEDLHRLAHDPGTVLLDTSRPDAENRQSLLFTAPRRVLTAYATDDVPGLLHQVDAAVNDGYCVAGYLGYESGYAFEGMPSFRAARRPLAWMGVYERPVTLAPEAVADVMRRPRPRPFQIRDAHLEIEREAYRERIETIKEHIRAGNVYQINFTDAVHFDLDGAPWSLYRALRTRQRVPYGAYVNTGSQAILCLSPELFFRRTGSRIWTRPMKGTVRRGRTLDEDEALQQWLAKDPKSRAENVMIVDLLRNDLSRCCQPGSVQVPALFTTERYRTVIQMTSTVEGRLVEGTSYAELFRALFPCGSVTGAPKIRAMRIIRDLESRPRGVYCGAIGYAAPGGEAVFNVAIRTVVVAGGHGVMGVGSGVVWDSEVGAEFDECRLKAHFLTGASTAGDDAFELIETMRWEQGAIPLLEGHVDRLRRSAAYFDRPFDEAAFRAAVAEAASQLDSGVPYKVRVTLDASGRLAVTTEPLDPVDPSAARVLVARERVDASDPLRFHKTSRRALYERAYARAREQGFDEVLFLNEEGMLTEGSRTNVFVERDGVLRTPPVEAGLLAGVYRRHVLESRPGAREEPVHPDDLDRADAVYVCNAVRGMQRVRQIHWEQEASFAT